MLFPRKYAHGINSSFRKVGFGGRNLKTNFWRQRRLLATGEWYLPFFVGLDEATPIVTDLSNLPHMLVAGNTGSGKSNYLRQVMLSLIINNRPQTCNVYILDGSGCDYADFASLTGYNRSGKGYGNSLAVLKKQLQRLLREMSRVSNHIRKMQKTNIKDLNKFLFEKRMSIEPHNVLFVDELARYLSDKFVYNSLVRIANEGRKLGFHLILSTQRPDASITKGALKANLNATAMFRVRDDINARVVSGSKNTSQASQLGVGEFYFSTQKISKKLKAIYVDPELTKQIIYNVKNGALL